MPITDQMIQETQDWAQESRLRAAQMLEALAQAESRPPDTPKDLSQAIGAAHYQALHAAYLKELQTRGLEDSDPHAAAVLRIVAQAQTDEDLSILDGILRLDAQGLGDRADAHLFEMAKCLQQV